ncbi:hypothetical protein CERSUDRAFT_103017 [Gelatoporia subvermispora B]|uniref:Uncharacterized protein n=1 Tax=Ceriporiopsis subvermispora (strain B) TaxID=914234 RepID=M2QU94_CERS8|nr:hypothetical protein CERSUDRAFT_103017 [Gelatoporia subvermispora B]
MYPVLWKCFQQLSFRAPPRPHARPIEQLTVRELHDRHALNARILAEPGASTSTYAARIGAEQAAIEARLVSLVGVENLGRQLQQTTIHDEQPMSVDAPAAASRAPQPQQPPRAISAKQRVLARYAQNANSRPGAPSMSLEEAVRLEQEAHVRDLQRQREQEERRARMGMPVPGEKYTREETEARLWAFMNYKGSESDYDEDEDEDDEDPATWFEDDQDDGRKGQNLVEPDYDDYSHIIRIDDSKIPYAIPPGSLE